MVITRGEHFSTFCVHKLVVEFGPESENVVQRGKLGSAQASHLSFVLRVADAAPQYY